MAGWVFWVILAGAFGVGEMLTGGFFLAPFALGAALAAAGDAAAVNRGRCDRVRAVASIMTLVLVRPIVRSHIRRCRRRSGPGGAALVGKQRDRPRADRQRRGRGMRQDRR